MADAAAVAARAFDFELRTPEQVAAWRARVEHLLHTDPSGGFVAVREGRIIGLAQAMLREGQWCLSLLTVDPGEQSAGAGRALLDATLDYGAAERRGAILVEDLGVLAPISRAPRGRAHPGARVRGRRPGRERTALEDRGFVIAGDSHAVWLLAAHDEPAAEALLRAALRERTASREPAAWVTAEQQWAMQALVGLGLRPRTWGPLCVRGEVGPLTPYLPSPAFG